MIHSCILANQQDWFYKWINVCCPHSFPFELLMISVLHPSTAHLRASAPPSNRPLLSVNSARAFKGNSSHETTFMTTLETLNMSVMQNATQNEMPRGSSFWVRSLQCIPIKRHEPKTIQSIISNIGNATKSGKVGKSRTFEIITSAWI